MLPVSAKMGADYPTLVPRITLSTTDTSVTPFLEELVIPYVDTITPLANTNFTLRSSKSIGTMTDGSVVPKVLVNSSTDGSGEDSITDIDWGEYTITVSGRAIAEVCPGNPFSLTPNNVLDVSVMTTNTSAHNARIEVVDATGAAVIGATISLTRAGYDVDVTSGWCGQGYFGGLVEASDYVLEVSAPGFVTNTTNPFSVSGGVVQKITMVAS